MPNPKDYGRVIVAGLTREEIAPLIPFAKILAQAENRQMVVYGLVQVPKEEPLSAGARATQRLRRELQSLIREMDAEIAVRAGHYPWSETHEAIKHSHDLLLVNWSSILPDDVLRTMPCHVIVVNGEYSADIKRILLPIRGGPYTPLALTVARAYARIHHAKITLLHAAPPERLQDPGYAEWFNRLLVLPEIAHVVNISDNAVDAIIQRADSQEHQLVVLGAIAQPQPGGPPIGPTATRVVKESNVPVMIVKMHQHSDPSPQPVDYTISVIVDKWFAENTFHASEFKSIKRLVEMKERQGKTISLALPALNEEATIGIIIKTIHAALMHRYPLLDEIVVIDSNSTDQTVAIAQDLGVPVYRHAEILPNHGSYKGKGEALWKSLYVLKGDIIAWIDTDILNIHPRFVYGILGPLLRESNLKYVKGFYQRPLKLGNLAEARGGGRVTELMARPLLNLFYPDLSGMVQPLAGEYAGSRDALESIPFFTGYGVEIGLLVDLMNTFGLSAISQVDLEERVHRNQSLAALSKMAYAILQVVMHRVETAHHIQVLNELNASMKLIRYEPEQFRLDVQEIRDQERPPMKSIPEYQASRGLS